MPWFDDETFEFLADLADNNERAWFDANKKRYEKHVKGPSLRFITDFAPRLAPISEHFRAIPKATGGSLFRIYRDTRFSKDKTPYKTHLGLHFKHARAKDVHAPGFYLHLEPNACFFGAGIWHPESADLKEIRSRLAREPGQWTEMKQGLQQAGLSLGGESLQRIPKGYDKEHPLAEDLKRKDFIVSCPVAEEVAMGEGLMDHFVGLCEGAAPLQSFLCDAVGVPF